MKITLIHPKMGMGIFQVGKYNAPPIGLATIASVTPKDVNVKIIDENVEKLKFSKTDLVGITSMTCTANRAYAIADKYRSIGIPVILGGIHVSAVPFEAIKHADCVVIGEAENVWGEVINDFREGRLKKFYKCSRPVMLNKVIDRSYLKRKKYMGKDLVQTSRGCYFNCDFCSVANFNGTSIRHRSVESVVKEIKSLKSKKIFIANDNIYADPKYAASLFKALIPLGIRWSTQSSINIAKDSKLLALAKKSGCSSLWIGFETVSQSGLDEVGKRYSVKGYSHLIKMIKSHGIRITGSFMFGFDSDDKTVFKKTADFAHRSGIEVYAPAILTPLPGTRLFNRFEKEGRLLTKNWRFYDTAMVVFKPKKMSKNELCLGQVKSMKRFYSIPRIFSRTFKELVKGRIYLSGILTNIMFWIYARVGGLIVRYNLITKGEVY